VHSAEPAISFEVDRERAACSLDEALDRLTDQPVCGYQVSGPPATEPTALAAMALAAHGRWDAAQAGLDWLVSLQSDEGSLGVNALHATPRWSTGWAVLAWQFALRQSASNSASAHDEPNAVRRTHEWTAAAKRAVAWMQSLYGQRGDNSPIVGHNTQLRGWPWVETTHSWVEPTAISVLALKSAGLGEGPRVREAVRMLLDRMIPTGGWNQANKMILGNALRPHIQPTGLALAALRGEPRAKHHAVRSIEYLKQRVSARTATASLCYAILGAAAHGQFFPTAYRYLAAAACRTLQSDASPYKLALLTLAAKGTECPWFDTQK
jgi:hypothetical protein